MIYTTYFAKLRSLPPDITPISICAKAPAWYSGCQYKRLAPTYDCLMDWKRTHDNDAYIARYNKEVLSRLSASQVMIDLRSLRGKDYGDIALVCYEKPSDFCHRHLVAQWLSDNGFRCTEWEGVRMSHE